MNGHEQALPLSCESRSAVDWAQFFGVSITEMTFQYALPFTKNPNTGFVGNPKDERGQVPPDSYGVHAEPVAALLRKYGLNATSYSGLSFRQVRQEIAAGRPVIVWVIGNVWAGYEGLYYTAPDGETMTVAAFEHTVIVTGYGPDYVTVLDGAMLYDVPLWQFFDSWGVLGNMGIVGN